jgi:hypothetical protein
VPAEAQPGAGVPEFPYPLEYLWDTFLEVTDAVPHDDYGAPQCLWTEILAWSELTGCWLQHWELQAIAWLGRTSQTVAAQAYVDHMKKPSTHG